MQELNKKDEILKIQLNEFKEQNQSLIKLHQNQLNEVKKQINQEITKQHLQALKNKDLKHEEIVQKCPYAKHARESKK